MAANDYEKASQLLEMIEYRYPRSRIQQKAKKIQEKLKRSSVPK